MATTTILYPAGAKFNMEYYLSSHMPLAAKHWEPLGLKSWKVTQLGEDSPYCVQSLLEWDSMEDFGKAIASPETKTIQDDVPNFSDKAPIIMAGGVVGKSS